jgi:mono/diheme cytochrome c family protein
MSGPLRGILTVLLVLAGLAALGAGGLFAATQLRFDQTYRIEPAAVEIPADAASLARGEETAQFLCAGCHGADMSGQVISESPMDGRAAAPNLTSGEGGIGATYADEDWVRAIRHGVGPDGRGLIGMPSDRFASLSDTSLGALIAYLKSAPPVDNDVPGTTVGPAARWNFLLWQEPLIPAEMIDHEALLAPARLYLPEEPEEQE